MRKNVYGRQLKRDKNERAALFKNLMSSLVLEEQIKTTEQKAKAIKGEVEKLVTRARKESRLAKKLLEERLTPKAIEKMIGDIAPRFEKRPGGYTRIVRIGRRFGDDATMVLMEWVEKSSKLKVKNEKEEGKKSEEKKEVKKETSKKEAKPKVKKEVKKDKKEIKKK